MRILVFGAIGNVGRRTINEALSRGHDVTAVVRDPKRFTELPAGVVARSGDARNVDDVADLAAGQDVVISATRPSPGNEPELVLTARSLLAGLAQAHVRLLLVGGAASLIVPGAGGATLIDDPGFPAAIRDLARACAEQLAVCRADSVVDWAYLSPPALLKPGVRTGSYRLGADEMLVDADGVSSISMEDFAVALLDEVEHPKHRRTRFTVGY